MNDSLQGYMFGVSVHMGVTRVGTSCWVAGLSLGAEVGCSVGTSGAHGHLPS